MHWIKSLSHAIDYIEANLTNVMGVDDVSRQGFSSGSHFQLVFHVVLGLTVGEYIRNRRLTRAAQDLAESKISDVAKRYQYDTPESFSKAFTRFHGVSPSRIKKGQARIFQPLSINVTVQGGFDMAWTLANDFHLLDWKEIEKDEGLSATEKYARITAWSAKARATNPGVFDTLVGWMNDENEWTANKLDENKQILIHGVFARFKEQNAQLRSYLRKLESSGVVNPPVFKALDDFDMLLCGEGSDWRITEAAACMFADFTVMQNKDTRIKIAGNKTGPHGTDSVEGLGYIGHLKNADAQVQWCLFLHEVAKEQQRGFQVVDFAYRHLPSMRFIGRRLDAPKAETFAQLDTLNAYASDIQYDVLLTHHYGRGVDVENGHPFYGRFMQADTPVPDGFDHFDFTHDYIGDAGFPFQSKFAFATFAGDLDAIHQSDGYDVGAMYDVTRNIILGQAVGIPYPEKYWTAEVFLDGHDKPSTAYMFSVVYD